MLTAAQKAAGWTFLALFVSALFWFVTGSLSPSSHSDPYNGCSSYVCEQIDAGNGP